ncbi:MAG: DUF4435 domain-containing protein [Proteobacteria bacterium]|nr:DUF4435 domain-containing protein [Pseudomonadota bacterium]
MLNSVTAHDISAEAKMVRTTFTGTILIVEGDDDVLFFEKYSTSNQFWLIPARGKKNVIDSIDLLENENFNGLLGIVDADFWNILPPKNISPNICVTDYHDMEIIIIESGALDRVLAEYGSQIKINALLKYFNASDIRQILYNAAYPIGILRFISLKNGLKFKFTGIKYHKFLDRKYLLVDIDCLLSTILSGTKCELSRGELLAIFTQEISEYDEAAKCQLCCGDDLIAILSIGLRKTLGTLLAHIASPGNLRSVLRLAYDSNDLKNTELYKCVEQWEAYNPPFKVFSI